MKIQTTFSLIAAMTLLLFTTHPVFGQAKKQLDHPDFAIWKTIRSTTLSNNGDWVAYIEQPGEGDKVLKAYEVNSGKTFTFNRGSEPSFTPDGKFLIYKVSPAEDSIKMLKRQKVDKSDFPSDTLAIFELAKRNIEKFPGLQKNFVPEEINNYVIYQVEPPKTEPDTAKSEVKKKKVKTSSKKNGYPLIIRNLVTGIEDTLPFVNQVEIAKSHSAVSFYSTGRDSTFAEGLYHYNYQTKELNSIAHQKGEYKQVSISEDGKRVGFIADVDTTESEIRPYQFRYYELGMDSARILNEGYDFINDHWTVSEHRSIRFSKDGSKVFFGVAPHPILQDTNLLSDEIVNVEVWNYQDPMLYTQQKVNAKRENNRSYLACYIPSTGTITQIASLDQPEIVSDRDAMAPFVLTYDSRPYQKEITWVGRAAKDIYVKNIESGKSELVGKEIIGFPRISPGFKYIYWYNEVDTAYYTYHIESKKTNNISSSIKKFIYDELNDRPTEPSSYGVTGWLKDDLSIFINDRYDIWKIDPSGKSQPINLTNGRSEKTTYRYASLDREERFIDPNQNMLLTVFDEKDKTAGYANLALENSRLTLLEKGPFRYGRRPTKAKNAETIVFTKENFQLFPDLNVTQDRFANSTKISDANAQQKKYAWGSIERVEWTAYDGQKIEGLLAKPANFDPNKKYPMLVNFYERSSHTLYSHRTPAPGRSTINYSFYTSRGYLIFNPDVPYKIGYPGESAYNSVVSGTEAMIKKGFVDRERIGLQGHSWGGYQVAHIITKTDMYACTESGAPVVNMISAYGGIRWGSGMSRMFQYERTQSRLGGTLWERPDLYIENSPIFNIDKVNTPVLILHNDEDTAVPWYQGIEFFMAMRRLNKPAWLLNYNGEPHWPVKLQNRKDFNIRMQQFFDHYLKKEPMPVWMEKGIPAIHKGILQGYELSEERG